MKIFLSHSGRNEQYALKFKDLLEALSYDITVFCSSDKGSIPSGANFNKYIFNELHSCDAFIPLLSNEYYNSRYCVMELGVAYSYFISSPEDSREDYIFPFYLPPLTASSALSHTPLNNLEAVEINSRDDLHRFLGSLKKSCAIAPNPNSKISSFATEMDQILLKNQDIFRLANEVVSCCNMDNVADDIREKDIIRHSFVDDSISVSYNLNPKERAEVRRPGFFSMVLKYVDGINIGRYLDFDNDVQFQFTLTNFTNSLKRIFVEFKYANQQKLHTFEIPLVAGDNHIGIPLAGMQSNALRNITEICFVAHPTDVVEDEGTYKIGDIRIC